MTHVMSHRVKFRSLSHQESPQLALPLRFRHKQQSECTERKQICRFGREVYTNVTRSGAKRSEERVPIDADSVGEGQENDLNIWMEGGGHCLESLNSLWRDKPCKGREAIPYGLDTIQRHALLNLWGIRRSYQEGRGYQEHVNQWSVGGWT
jgi:hypothetical protein